MMIIMEILDETGMGAGESGSLDSGTKRMELLQSSLIRYCLSLTESRWDAEDLAQDTWVKALAAFNSLSHTNQKLSCCE